MADGTGSPEGSGRGAASDRLGNLAKFSETLKRARRNPDVRHPPSQALIDQVDACVAGRITREELDRWLTQRDSEDLAELHKVPFPRAATRRWIDCTQGAKAEDPLDRAAIGRSRDEYMRWYSKARDQATDILGNLASVLEHGLDAEIPIERLRWFVRTYADVPWWPAHYSHEPESEPNLTLMDLLERQLRNFEGPEHGFH